jgi:diguanylate cyclase (GGDEF)-like protein/PAS domain S-box-containing protein
MVDSQNVLGASAVEEAFERAEVGMVLMDVDGQLLRVNAAFCDLAGRPSAELVYCNVATISHPDDALAAVDAPRRRVVRGNDGTVQVLVTPTLVRDLDGAPLYYLAQIRPESTSSDTALGHDPLTDLPNRHLLLDRLELAMRRVQRWGSFAAVLVFGLDRFRHVNEGLGRDVGDRVLMAVAGRLGSSLRGNDTVARLGEGSAAGDQFAVLCEDLTGEEQAVNVALRLARVVSTPFSIDGHDIQMTTSIGINLVSIDHHEPEGVLADAELAMQRAKRAGGDAHEVFDEAVRARALRRLQTENGLRQAVARGELRLHYQPTIHLDTGRLVGVEALVRWQHPERGLLAPNDFIPLAEESGLIVPIGAWVLREACAQAVEWKRRLGPQATLTMSVNVSPRQLADPDLPRVVSEALINTGLDPSTLSLEITETVLLGDSDVTAAALQALKALGVRLEVDDFGTGYSSLSYLRRFPVDGLKVDRSFVMNLLHDAKVEAIVNAVVGLAHGLGIRVVAEGVETSRELDALGDMGCDVGQGYHWSRPLPPQELDRWMEAQKS